VKVYFIRESFNQYIKIGVSADVGKRIKTLQTASAKKLHVKAILDGGYQTEAGLHELFKSHRIKGTEWFRFNDEIKWFLRAIEDNPEVKNIQTLHILSQQMRLMSKAKRLKKKKNNDKLLKHIEKVCGV
jgi:Meiotically up-regulated gene 113